MEKKLSWSLLFLRLSVFLVMIFWTLDKFINPSHAQKVFKHFYFLPNMTEFTLSIIALVQLIIVLGFVAGFQKKYTYGLILIMHLISTLSSFNQYLNPWKHLLFFAAWPMLAACVTLYLLRDWDNYYCLDKKIC